MIAFLFPGQGSQEVGMGQALATMFPVAKDTFAEADAALGDSLSSLVFAGPADQLQLTANTQPAILTMSTAACRVLAEHGVRPNLVAGHSLGEYSAHVAAGTFAFADAVRIVRRRGQYMQEAVPVGTGAMAAILGLDLETVRRVCTEAASGDVVSPANINAAEQVVIAGTATAVARAIDLAKARGARRAVLLPVSAPFHCALMKPAEERLAPELRAMAARDPLVPVVANVDAEAKTTAGAAVGALVEQIAAPVQWTAVMERLVGLGATVFVEVGPGAVLSGLGKRLARGATFLTCASPDDVKAVVTAVTAR